MTSQQCVSLAPSAPRALPAAVAERPGGDTDAQQPGRGGDICAGAEADAAFIVGKQYAFVRVLLFLF